MRVRLRVRVRFKVALKFRIWFRVRLKIMKLRGQKLRVKKIRFQKLSVKKPANKSGLKMLRLKLLGSATKHPKFRLKNFIFSLVTVLFRMNWLR